MKVFGIGLNKTGTTTLGKCGEILGYRCFSGNRSLLKDIILQKDFNRIKETVKQNDLFEDWPWPLIYKELDEMYPNSKFILTVRRNEQVWLESLKQHSLRTRPFLHSRKLAYGYNFPTHKEKEHIEFYRKHNESVRNHFAGREEDFIEICWESGDDFTKLCNFLGREIPNLAIPHANKGSSVQISRKRYWMNKLLIFLRF